MRTTKSYVILAGLFILSLIGTGCTGDPSPKYPTLTTGLMVDPVFRAFYNYLGGEALLGPAISASFPEGQTTAQFVRAGKMVFDPSAPASGKFRMAPLGLEMDVREPPKPASSNPGMPYLGDHTILPDFYPLYEQLGQQTVGLPLTEPRHNLAMNRYEQFFENLGFYRLEGQEDVRLLAYGDWACGPVCRNASPGSQNAVPQTAPPREATIEVYGSKHVDPVFLDFYTIHGSDFTGFPLGPAQTATDGQWEQILENVVLVTESRLQPGQVSLRPLSEILQILPEAPRSYSGDPNMYFLPGVDPNLGYEIPMYFWEYIAQKGGLSVFGLPITHFTLLRGSVYHQCFQNLCLSYDPGANEAARIRPEPLGYAYRLLYGSSAQPTLIPTLTFAPTRPPDEPTLQAVPPTVEPVLPTAVPVMPTVDPLALATPTGLPEAVPVLPTAVPVLPTAVPALPTAIPILPTTSVVEITIQVMVRYKVVEVNDVQEVAARILENGQPVLGASVDVTIGMPDGSLPIYPMSLTDGSGYTSVQLPVIIAPPSTVIPYKVCYTTPSALRVCVADSFTIWLTP